MKLIDNICGFFYNGYAVFVSNTVTIHRKGVFIVYTKLLIQTVTKFIAGILLSGLLLLVPAGTYVMYTEVMRENAWLSRVVEIQFYIIKTQEKTNETDPLVGSAYRQTRE